MTRWYDHTWLWASVAVDLQRVASYGTYDGTPATRRYLERCRGVHVPTGTVLIYTRDTGMHDGGWFKNPDFNQCAHLSVSYRNPATDQHRPHDKALSKRWAETFFHQHCRLLWVEPPFSDDGKRWEVYHYRLFCDRFWTPILPRKEVYSTTFTAIGWKSWSDLHGDDPPVEPPLGREA